LATFLFILGLVLEFVGFATGHAEDIPVVLPLVAPAPFNAAEGIRQLEAGRALQPADSGFAEISEIMVDLLRASYPPEIFEKVHITKITPFDVKPPVEIRAVQLERDVGLTAHFSNQEYMNFRVSQVGPVIDGCKRTALLRVSVVIFGLGILLQVVGFVRDRCRRVAA
jgi:hypothetical protein